MFRLKIRYDLDSPFPDAVPYQQNKVIILLLAYVNHLYYLYTVFQFLVMLVKKKLLIELIESGYDFETMMNDIIKKKFGNTNINIQITQFS